MTKYILALSDQQLVTGLAIQIAGYGNYCNLSVESYTIIQALAWFSSTTNLAALEITEGYLREQPKAKTWRIIGVLLSLILLLVGVILPTTPSWDTSEHVYCALTGFSVTNDGLAIFTVVTVVIFLVISFAADEGITALHWILKKIWGVDMSLVNRSRELETETYQGPVPPMAKVLHYVWTKLGHSFLWRLLWILFGVIYGLVEVSLLRLNLVDSDDANKFGFGQIVPLLLLALPVLGAVDSYFVGK